MIFFGGSLLNLITFMFFFTEINYCYFCSVMKFTLIHTTTAIKHDGQGT